MPAAPRSVGAAVIVLLNGAFGAGKTTAARLVRARLRGAAIVDPELLGWALQHLLFLRGDYQDRPSWRWSTVLAARVVRLVRPIVIVPMTIWRAPYFDAIAAGLSAIDADFVPLRLLAGEAALRRRIEARGGSAREWSLAHLERCTRAFESARYGQAIDTDGRSPDDVADAIVRHLRDPRFTRPAG
jgi:chloramphenicol 3-O-phosphotransferase